MRKTIGIVVTFNPPSEFFLNLEVLLEQLERVLIVDNGSEAEKRDLLVRVSAHRSAAVLTILCDTNLGVGAALNRGFLWALEQGYEEAFVFDQDSSPLPGAIAELVRAYDSHPERDRVAIVASQIQDGITGEKIQYLRRKGAFFLERIPCRDGMLEDVLLVIGSGSLYRLAACKKIGAFREDLFIDYVDTEYCLRANRQGYNIIVACHAVLQHRLGDQRRRRIGSLTLRPTFHSPLRWYYINRNRIAMYREYALAFPQWASYDFLTGLYAFLKLLLFEDRKLKKMLALILGVWDGLFYRLGAVSPSRKRRLDAGS